MRYLLLFVVIIFLVACKPNVEITTANDLELIEIPDNVVGVDSNKVEKTDSDSTQAVAPAPSKTTDSETSTILLETDVNMLKGVYGTDSSSLKSTVRFVVSESEALNIKKSRIRFIPECQLGGAGLLTISINEHVIYSSVPDCGTARPLDLAPFNIITGENELTFNSEHGRYLIDQIKITTESQTTEEIEHVLPSVNLYSTTTTEPNYYDYSFDIPEALFQLVKIDQREAQLVLKFSDVKRKEAEFIINGRKAYMTSHNNAMWSKDISNFIHSGSNELKIIPEEDMEIDELIVKIITTGVTE